MTSISYEILLQTWEVDSDIVNAVIYTFKPKIILSNLERNDKMFFHSVSCCTYNDYNKIISVINPIEERLSFFLTILKGLFHVIWTIPANSSSEIQFESTA